MVNTVTYNGKLYATLADSYVDTISSTYYYGSSSRCQSGYMSLPVGWMIASDVSDSLNVIATHNWNTDVVVVASGVGYGTLSFSQGAVWTTTGLLTSGSTYAVCCCSLQILITCTAGYKPSGSSCAACAGGYYSTDGTSCVAVSAGINGR